MFLAPEEPSQRLLDFIDDQDIALHHLGVSSLSSTNAWDPISEEIVLEAAELILNSNNYPLMIMCNLGRHRTGSKKGVDIMIQIFFISPTHHPFLQPLLAAFVNYRNGT